MSQAEGQACLPDLFTHSFWKAAADEMGLYSLNMILLRAGLEKYVIAEKSPPRMVNLTRSELGLFQSALRLYFGRGARGLLTRTGRGTWQIMTQNLPFHRRLLMSLLPCLPLTIRIRLVLRHLEGFLRFPGCSVRVAQEGKAFEFLLSPCLGGTDQPSEEPICWMMAGLIQGAVQCVTRRTFEVEEVACQAVGAEACRFRIQLIA